MDKPKYLSYNRKGEKDNSEYLSKNIINIV